MILIINFLENENDFSGGPTLYSHSNRTAVTADAATLILYIVFITLFLAFVIIFPGVRSALSCPVFVFVFLVLFLSNTHQDD